MKIPTTPGRLLLPLAWLLSLVLAPAQQPTTPANYASIDYATIRLKDFKAMVAATSSGDASSEIVRRTIISGRRDLMLACYETFSSNARVRYEFVDFF